MSSISADCFVVINGPQDGAEFPIVRAPFYIGQDPGCAVRIRLDTAVRPFHAAVSVVSEGYRVRKTNSGPVFVNGNRTGALRSRIVRSGGTVQVGNTLLAFESAPGGLASRSRGIVTESDFVWAVRRAVLFLVSLLSTFVTGLTWIVRRLLGSWLAILSVLVLLYLFWPWFHSVVQMALYTVYYRLIWRLIGQILGS